MRSMTGFGKASGPLPDGTEAAVVVRGVNHRFLDVALKLKDEWTALEPAVRRLVGDVAKRGHIDVFVRTTRPVGGAASFDDEAASRYAAQWSEAAARRGLPAELSARDLLNLPGVVRTGEAGEPDDESKRELLRLAREAIADFDASRLREGEALAEAIRVIHSRLEEGIGRLDVLRGDLSARLLAALRERVRKLAEGLPFDEVRLAQEIALLADRADVTEEVDRFRAHLAELASRLSEDGPVGRRLDFLAQELHRESNTAGQKMRELPALRAVLDLKSDVEALKEQVQNVE